MLRTDGLESTWLEDWLPNSATKLEALVLAMLSVSEVQMGMTDGEVEDHAAAEEDLQEWMTKAKDAVIESIHALIDEFVSGVLTETGTEEEFLIPFLDDLRDAIAEQSVTMAKALLDLCPHCGKPLCCGTTAEVLDSWESLA